MNVIRRSANRLGNAVEISHYSAEISLKPFPQRRRYNRRAVLCAKYDVRGGWRASQNFPSPLPGRFSFSRFRWLTPPAKFRQPFGLCENAAMFKPRLRQDRFAL